MSHELYKRYRPKTVDQLIGQDAIVPQLKKWMAQGSIPHTLLLCGPSGCGKTSIARMLRQPLNCGTTEFVEINAADFSGIATVRELRSKMHLKSMQGSSRIWLLDECHALTKDAQNAILKMLEDTPSHVYFFLATTNPEKIITTIKNRSTILRVKALTAKDSKKLLDRVLKKEKKSVSEDVSEALVEAANGSARKLLVLLQQIVDLEEEGDQLASIEKADSERQAIELARLLMQHKIDWGTLSTAITEIDEEPETLRRMVLGYCSSVMLKGGKLTARAYIVIDAFRDPFYDSGKAGLIAACWETMANQKASR